MISSPKNWSLMLLMLLCAATAWLMRPTQYLADTLPKLELGKIVPTEFGNWKEVSQPLRQIINPQQEQLLNKLYSETLTRTYINTAGAVVMLSIAYGVNQSDAVALHYPEVCYPAQGFQILNKYQDTLMTSHANLSVKKLVTKLGTRTEPVTYWSTIGEKLVESGIKTKLAQMSYSLSGKIPDGLIFRVSTIGIDTAAGFSAQEQFVRELLPAIPDTYRSRLAGSASSTPSTTVSQTKSSQSATTF